MAGGAKSDSSSIYAGSSQGAARLMFYLVDLASGWTSAYLVVVGAALLALVLFFPAGIVGAVRARFARWLP